MTGKENRLNFRMTDETAAKIERWYLVGTSCISFTPPQAAGFTHSAVPPLQTATAMLGCGLVSERFRSCCGSVLFMLLVGIISDIAKLDRDDLKRRRTQSVKHVKQTNGRISLEKREQMWDETTDWDDDEWQG